MLSLSIKENKMDLKELLKTKQQNLFNKQQKQKVPVLAQKPIKRATGRGR